MRFESAFTRNARSRTFTSYLLPTISRWIITYQRGKPGRCRAHIIYISTFHRPGIQEAFAKRPGSRQRLEWMAVKADLVKPSRPLDAKRQTVFQHCDY